MLESAAYLLCKVGGKGGSADDIKAVLEAAGAEVDEEALTKFCGDMEGKDVNELLAEGMEKVKDIPLGGGGGGGGGAAAGGDAGAAEEEKKEEKEEVSLYWHVPPATVLRLFRIWNWDTVCYCNRYDKVFRISADISKIDGLMYDLQVFTIFLGHNLPP